MSLFLRLLPIEDINESITNSGNFLNCEKDYHLFEQIDQLAASPVPRNFQTYFDKENGYVFGTVINDAFGEELNFVFVKDLLKCKPNSKSQTNRAIWSYLKQLPSEGKIALYWN